MAGSTQNGEGEARPRPNGAGDGVNSSNAPTGVAAGCPASQRR